MGIFNLTDDSFYHSYYKNNEKNIDNIIEKIIAEKNNFDILDFGGESTRPYAKFIDEKIEIERVIPIIKKIKNIPEMKDKIISLDTRKVKKFT